MRGVAEMKKKDLSETNAEAILAFANGDMRIYKAAKIMCVVPFDISYHLDRVKKITGLDPRKFYDLVRLVPMARKIVGGIDDGQT